MIMFSRLSPPPLGGREGGISTLFPEEPELFISAFRWNKPNMEMKL